MGSQQSSHADSETKDVPIQEQFHQKGSKESVKGRKSNFTANGVIGGDDKQAELVSSEEESEETDIEEETEEEIDAGLEERRKILEDAMVLKKYATFHLHPEKKVETTDPFASGRNYFDRPAAPEQESFADAEERAAIMEEVKMLKMYATFHLHPEKPVETTEDTVAARNFFGRASAPEQESWEAAEERARILEDAKMLKMHATFHLHPEKPVVSTDGAAFGRNYFNRPSGVKQESAEEAEEKARIMEEAALLKQYATFHLHPETPVETTDTTACGRNFFSRPSADEYETEEDAEEREQVLADCAALRTYAGYHLHPEKAVEVDPALFGRNYFDRVMGPGRETLEEAEERALILEEAALLKKYATFHLHPEKPVTSTADPTSFGRNYFGRVSAEEQETLEEVEERARVLEEVAALKKYASFHLHPENPVETTDPAVFGRNYFSRPSADEYDTEENAEEREHVLAECAALKTYAGYHLHPEKSVETTDSTACGRNYFSRPSADEYETEENADEREQILAECAALKTYAGYHLHPEKSVEPADPALFGRNYFGRASAPDQETLGEVEERARILEEAALLKTYATFHLHPEKPVETSDPAACGRNYFSRPSADEHEGKDDAEERSRILEETALLKKYATFHLHPERPVETTDSTACGRNYFSRPSADEYELEEDAEEREQVLAECAALKTYAGYHMHPEKPVDAAHPALFGRNYFSRASAPDQETLEDVEERTRVLEEAAELKKYATYHLHPEKPVEMSDPTACGRNYFSRPSADEYEGEEDAEERSRILEETALLKKYATFHLHPEKPVAFTADPTSFGRNYFSRASAPDQETLEEAEERAQILAEAESLKTYAGYHLHPEKPVKCSGGDVFGRSYFSRASAEEQENAEEAGERDMVLAECALLKKYAGFHLHPERSVSTDPTAFGRNYFGRPSAIVTEPVSHEAKDADDGYGHHVGMEELCDLLTEAVPEYSIPLSSGKEKSSKSKSVGGSESDEEGGNISRSPSDVMLFGLVDQTAF